MQDSIISWGELSYYGLSLLSFLRENHPLLAEDTDFITQRADSAAQVYSEAIQSGHNHIEAEEAASEELYRGLRFSAFNTLVNILWDEFSGEVSEDEARSVALRLYPLCVNVLERYSLSDDFDMTPQYGMLYTELVGSLQILLENGF